MRMGIGLHSAGKANAVSTDRVAPKCLAFLKEALGNFHPRDFRIRLWDESVWDAEPGEPARFTFVLKTPDGFRAMFRSPSETTLGEAYLRQDLDVEGDLGDAFDLVDRLIRMPASLGERLRCARLLLSLPSSYRARHVRPAERLRGSLHSRERDRQAVTYHYDLSNDFYALWLDDRMVYSCAYFTDPAGDLQAAQERKLQYICRKLRLHPGDRLLDIGCGWGALVLHAAERFGAEAHGITLSRPQAERANERIRGAGMAGRCRVDLRDYREIDAWGGYDKLVSVGMFEHVGEVRMWEYFGRAFRLLRPGGVFLNHGIACHSGIPSNPGPSFSDHYVFPDGELVPIATVLRAAEAWVNAVPRTNGRCATLSRRIAAARGDAPADIVLRNARLVDVLSGRIRSAEIAVVGDSVVGVGRGYRGRVQLDLGGRFVCPGLIDAHVHLESSLVRPREFARAVVPRGVTTVVMNPHEIANVLGAPGIRYLMRETDAPPFHAFVTVPSCVPATRLATTGAQLSVSDLLPFLSDPRVVGLGEVMDFPGVVAGDARVLEEIAAFEGRPVDGHCPGLGGRKLNAYVAAGISSDHECVTPEEAEEKLRLGMRIFLREGSTARNLKSLLPVLTPENERRIAFCTDDRQPKDLLEEGSIDHLVRTAIACGVSPVRALRMATLNPAEHFRLFDRGIVAPGYRADMMIFRDLSAPRAEMVFHGGVAVASDGAMLPRETKEAGSGREIPRR